VAFLTSEQIKAKAASLPYQDVPVPELEKDGVVRVRCLTALEKDRYDQSFWLANAKAKTATYNADGARALLLRFACCAVNEDGTTGGHLFTDADIPMLRDMRCDVGERLFDVAQRLSGLKADMEALKNAFGVALAGASPTS
jgi:hypothetical protein